MLHQALLDTHIVVRWLLDPKRLSQDQRRILQEVVRRRETLAISGVTLVEIATLADRDFTRKPIDKDQIFRELEANPVFRILPLTIEIAREIVSLSSLRDPADRAIVATARVHGLRLMTSDQRIIESNMVSIIE